MNTVTWKLHIDVLLDVSVAVHVTVVVPTGKQDPEAGLHTTVATAQLSLAVGAGNVTVTHGSVTEAVCAVIFPGQVIVGA